MTAVEGGPFCTVCQQYRVQIPGQTCPVCAGQRKE